MLIIGCDYHPSFQQIALVDTASGECSEKRVAIKALGFFLVSKPHGFGRLCRATTNTMRFPVTPVSCASSGVAYADYGGAF